MIVAMTKNDISQISKLLDNKLAPVQSKLSQHDKVLDQHSEMLSQQSKVLNQHTKILRSLKKDQSTMLEMLDGEQMKQRRRIKRIEEHLGLPPAA